MWRDSLELIEVDQSRDYILLCQDEQPACFIAALEPKGSSALLGAFLTNLLVQNGQTYGIELFGGLPTRTLNYCPELIQPEVLVQGFWDWMTWAETKGWGDWIGLRDTVIGLLADEPKPIRAVVRNTFKDLPPNPSVEDCCAWLERRKRLAEEEAAQLSLEDRRRILENYFYASYREGAKA